MCEVSLRLFSPFVEAILQDGGDSWCTSDCYVPLRFLFPFIAIASLPLYSSLKVVKSIFFSVLNQLKNKWKLKFQDL